MKLLKGGGKPKHHVTCPKCGGMTFLEGRSAIHRTGNKLSAGVKAKICALCMSNGQLTIL